MASLDKHHALPTGPVREPMQADYTAGQARNTARPKPNRCRGILWGIMSIAAALLITAVYPQWFFSWMPEPPPVPARVGTEIGSPVICALNVSNICAQECTDYDCPEIFPKVCQSKEAANIDFIIFAFRDAYENFLELLRLEEKLSADIETLKKYLYSIYSNLTKLVSLRQHGDIQSVDLNVLEAGIDQCRGGLGLGANLSTTVNSKGHDILSEILQAVLVQTEFTRDSIAQVQGDESVKLNLSGTYQKMNLPQKATKEYSYNVAVDWNFILQRLYGSASPYEKEIAPEETLRSRFYRHAMEWKCRLQSRNEQEEQRQAYTDLEKFQTEFLSLIDVLEPATEELLIDRARTTGSWSPLKRLAVSAGFVKTPWNLYHINDVLGSFEGLFTSIENASDLIQPFRDMWTKSLAIDANLNTALEELSKAGGSLDALGEEGHQQLESLFQLFDTNARTLREAIVEPE